MKKVIVAIAAMLIALGANAQQFGIIGGLTSSTLKIKDAAQDYKSVNMFHLGIAYNQPLVLGLAIQPAIEYKVKGAKLGEISGVGDLDLKSGFVEIPVQVQWGWDLAVARPYIFAEPFVGYAVTNKLNIKTGSLSGAFDEIKQAFEYGVGIGAGVDIFKRVQVSARWYWNMGSLAGFDKISTVKDTMVNTNANGLEVSAAIFF